MSKSQAGGRAPRSRAIVVRLAALVVGVSALAQVIPGRAATPSTVDVYAGGGSPAAATWTGGPLVGNPDPAGPPAPQCQPSQGCDRESVVLHVPANYTATHVVTLSATVTAVGAGGSTWDISILDSNGNLIASNSSGVDPNTTAAADIQAGTYTVEIDGDVAAGDNYTATATASSAARTAQQVNPPGTLGFSREVVTDPFRLGTEPTIQAATDGTVYEGPIFGSASTQSFLNRSDDSGRTFHALGVPPGVGKVTNCTGGGDEDIATDQFPGDLFFIDLSTEPTVPAAVTNDKGATFATDCEANDQSNVNSFPDRQWLSTDTVHGLEWYIYRDGLVNQTTPTDSFTGHVTYGEYIKHAPLPTAAGTAGSANLQFTSLCTNAATLAVPCVTDVAIAGNAVTNNFGGPNLGITYVAESTASGIGLMVIDPTGAHEVTAVPGGKLILFPTVAVDHAGNLYMAYTDATTFQVKYTYSTDQGGHWTTPVTVNGAPAATTVMPWIVAGDNGRVDIVFYGSPTTQAPTVNYGPWNAYMLQSLTADTATQNWTQQAMTDRPNHVDPVCLSGLGCTVNTGPGGDRELGDFFRVVLDPQGRALVSFADGNNLLGQEVANKPIPSPSFADFVRQSAGPSLYAAVGNVPSIPIDTNSVTVPEHSNPIPFVAPAPVGKGPSDTALELLGSSASVTTDAANASTVHVTMTVSNLDATAAITAPGLPTATYLTRWWHNGQIYYAAAEDNATQWRFFSGQVAPVSDGLAIKYAYYPSTGTATGTVTPGPGGTISITVPAGQVGDPTANDTLYSVTSYALTHTAPTAPTAPTASNFTDIPQVADLLPAYNVVPGPSTNIPEARASVLLVLVGVGGMAIAVLPWRRRRRLVHRA